MRKQGLYRASSRSEGLSLFSAVHEGETMKYQGQFDEMRELVLAAKGPEDVQAREVISLH